MTILKTKDGQEIDTAQFKGYGEFTRYVQENIDRKFGKGTTDLNKWKVTLTATKTCPVSTEIEVEAETDNEAKKKALEEARKLSNMDWNECYGDEDIDDIEIDEVEEAEEEEDE